MSSFSVHCGGTLTEGARFCKNCGTSRLTSSHRARSSSTKVFVISVGLTVIAFLALVVFWSTIKDKLSDARKLLNDALKETSGVRDSFIKAGALLSIGSAQAKAGDIAAAEKTFQQAVQSATSIPLDWQRDMIIGLVVSAQAKGRSCWRCF